MSEDDQQETEDNLRPRPVVLLLIDGWGVAPANEANAISKAKTPTFLNLIKEYPVALLNPGDKNLNTRYLSLGSGREMADENEPCPVNLSAAIADAHLKQVKIGETERLAALTHFFNGHNENKYPGEDWKIVSSQAGDKSVKPLLALRRTVKEIVKAIDVNEPADLIVAVIPYLDLMAATGNFSDVKKAVTEVDKSIRNILSAVQAKNGALIISAAGGNAERMRDLRTDLNDLDMTENPVPFVIVGPEYLGKTIGLADPVNNDLSSLSPAGTLADVAPTILHILKLDKPEQMTGSSLWEEK